MQFYLAPYAQISKTYIQSIRPMSKIEDIQAPLLEYFPVVTILLYNYEINATLIPKPPLLYSMG